MGLSPPEGFVQVPEQPPGAFPFGEGLVAVEGEGLAPRGRSCFQNSPWGCHSQGWMS